MCEALQVMKRLSKRDDSRRKRARVRVSILAKAAYKGNNSYCNNNMLTSLSNKSGLKIVKLP